MFDRPLGRHYREAIDPLTLTGARTVVSRDAARARGLSENQQVKATRVTAFRLIDLSVRLRAISR
jgi:hypothetical protein